jgi:hypothetical protein
MPGQRVSFYVRRVVAATVALGVVAAAGAPADRVTLLVVLAAVTAGLVVVADLTVVLTARAAGLLVTGDLAGAFVVATLDGATGLAGTFVVTASAAARALRLTFGFIVVVVL